MRIITILAFLLITSCGTGTNGFIVESGNIPSPVGPTNKLTGTYTIVVQGFDNLPAIEEHQTSDPYFFFSSYGFVNGDTSRITFDNTNTCVSGLFPYTKVIQFNQSTSNNYTASVGNTTSIDGITTYNVLLFGAPFNNIHYDINNPTSINYGQIIEDFLGWRYIQEWNANIVPTQYIKLELDMMAKDFDETNTNTSSGTVRFILYPIPTQKELGSYSGNYNVEGEYENPETYQRTPVNFTLILTNDGIITSSLTGNNMFQSYINQGFLGSTLTAQLSGPANTNPSGSNPPFDILISPNDLIIQKWDLTVDMVTKTLNGGTFQQSINVFPDQAFMENRTKIIGQKVYIKSIQKSS